MYIPQHFLRSDARMLAAEVWRFLSLHHHPTGAARTRIGHRMKPSTSRQYAAAERINLRPRPLDKFLTSVAAPGAVA